MIKPPPSVVSASYPGRSVHVPSAARSSSLNTAPGSFTVSSSASTLVSTTLPNTGLFVFSAVIVAVWSGMDDVMANPMGSASMT